ncbi:MAG: hypothetical protein MUO89_00535 [Dehalococcoidia bacterium]|nr:hypothetical protein [Dehalococcoidia bacterium]
MKNIAEQLIQDRVRDLHQNTDFISNPLFESLIGYAIIAYNGGDKANRCILAALGE